MKLNAEILDAINRAVDYYGNTSQFAKEIGVAHSTVLFWLSGKTANINGTIWEKRVRRVLRKFMRPASTVPCVIRDPAVPFSSSQTAASSSKDKEAGKKVPAIAFSRMEELDITIQSPVSFVRRNASAEVAFANDCTDFSFALLLDDRKFCSSLPLGTRLLICGADYAEDGDIVIGKTRHPAKLFLCRLHRSEEGDTRLEPLNPEQPEMVWKTRDNAEKVFWIFPVSEISIDLRSCRWQENMLIDKKE